MSLIFTIAVIGLVASAFVYFWNDIREFLNGTVRDLIEKVVGKVWGDRFAELVIWLDRGVNLVKKTLEAAYNGFKQNVLRMGTVYKGIQDKRAKIKITTVLVKLPSGMGQETTYESKVHWHEMPDSVRADAIKSRANTAEIDYMDVVDRRYKEKMAVAH